MWTSKRYTTYLRPDSITQLKELAFKDKAKDYEIVQLAVDAYIATRANTTLASKVFADGYNESVPSTKQAAAYLNTISHKPGKVGTSREALPKRAVK